VKRLAVYCGSSFGNDAAFAVAARDLGHALVRCGCGLVYGGGKVGLMGVVADAVIKAGGEAIGVIPQVLFEREIAHTGLSQLLVAADMHERKAKMMALADGFIAMPGGVGTLEELFEVWTWAQLGYHQKPVGCLNVVGYFDKLLGFLDGMVEAGFQKSVYRQMLAVSADPEALLEQMTQAVPAPQKWS
jgi:uncharacterized protein (TIGR00730 family)